MVFFLFGISAIMLILLAIMLSLFADIIDHRSSLKDIFVSLLIGGAAALPEITTSITSIVIANPDLAVGNVLGSNLFNITILAVMDIIFRKHRVFNYSYRENSFAIGLIIILSLFAALFIFLEIPYHIFHIGLDTVFIIVLYVIGVKLISKLSVVDNQSREYLIGIESVSSYDVSIGEEKLNIKEYIGIFKDISIKQAFIGFTISAALIMFFGSMLTISADKISVISGLGSTFVGSFLLAACTSLPEAVSVATAIRLKNYNLAIGAILGSCLFNFLNLSGTDILYRTGNLLSTASTRASVYSFVCNSSDAHLSICSYSQKELEFLYLHDSFGDYRHILLHS